jgi:hypothetical protein
MTRYKSSYDLENDLMHGDGSFGGYGAPHGIIGVIIIPCFLLALIWNEGFEAFEILWAFSIYLEAVAILPQLFMLQRTKEVRGSGLPNTFGRFPGFFGVFASFFSQFGVQARFCGEQGEGESGLDKDNF